MVKLKSFADQRSLFATVTSWFYQTKLLLMKLRQLPMISWQNTEGHHDTFTRTQSKDSPFNFRKPLRWRSAATHELITLRKTLRPALVERIRRQAGT